MLEVGLLYLLLKWAKTASFMDARKVDGRLGIMTSIFNTAKTTAETYGLELPCRYLVRLPLKMSHEMRWLHKVLYSNPDIFLWDLQVKSLSTPETSVFQEFCETTRLEREEAILDKGLGNISSETWALSFLYLFLKNFIFTLPAFSIISIKL